MTNFLGNPPQGDGYNQAWFNGKKVTHEQLREELSASHFRPFPSVAEFMFSGDTMKRQIELESMEEPTLPQIPNYFPREDEVRKLENTQTTVLFVTADGEETKIVMPKSAVVNVQFNGLNKSEFGEFEEFGRVFVDTFPREVIITMRLSEEQSEVFRQRIAQLQNGVPTFEDKPRNNDLGEWLD